MKRVLITFDKGLSHGGVQSVIMSIVRELSDKYIFDILVNVSQKQYFDDEFLKYGGKIIKIPFYEDKITFRKRADYYIRGLYLYKKTLQVIKENGPYDIIHCNNVYESGPILRAAKKCKIPTRIVHSHAIPCKEPFIRRILNRIYMNQIKNSASVFVGCSSNACDSLFGNNIKANVIYNAFDETKFGFLDTGLHKENNIILTQVGRYDSNKNQSFSIKVAKSLIDRKVDCKLFLIGSDQGYEEKKLKEEVKQLGIENNVMFLNTDANIQSFLSKSDAFIFPSITEGFGTALIEAQAVGVKCFVSDSVPNETNCGGCIYLPLNDGPKKWAEVILDDYSENKGIHKIYDCSRFRNDEIKKQYEKLYK